LASPTRPSAETAESSDHRTDQSPADRDTLLDREIAVEQAHLDTVYRRLGEKLAEAEFLLDDANRKFMAGTPGALAERDAQVYQAGRHLQRLTNEFEDFLFGRIDLQQPDRPEEDGFPSQTPLDPSDPDIAETLHVGRLGVLDAEYGPLVIDWRAPAAAPFYRATPRQPGRVVRRRVIRSRGRRVLGVEDDLLRPDLEARLDGEPLAVVGDGALMATLGRARGHSMRDIVSSIQQEQDEVIRAQAAGATLVTGGPGTGKTAVALHRAAYLLYHDRRRYAGGILVVSPTPLLVSYTEGVLPALGEEGQVAIRAIGGLLDGEEADRYDTPETARIKGSSRMLPLLRRAARAALDGPDTPSTLRVVAQGEVLRLDADALRNLRRNVLGGNTPVNLLRPRARRMLLDALWTRLLRGRPAPVDRYEPEEQQRQRESFDEYVADEDAFLDFLDAWWPALTPRMVLAVLADQRRLGGLARGAFSRAELRLLSDSWKHLDRQGRGGVSVADVALLDELHTQLGEPYRPRARELDPMELLTGLDEVTTYGDRQRREQGQRAVASERRDYAHVIVDEAQDLTPMQWRMVGRRARNATWTIVGDPAQSSWIDPAEAQTAMDETLAGKSRRRFTLTTNYRNPAEIADVASRILAQAAPGTEPPIAVRSTGVEPRFAAVAAEDEIGDAARAEVQRLLDEVEGTVGIVVPMDRREEARAWIAGLGERAVALGSLEAKGLEYDATVVADPSGIAGESEAGLRVLYVALTRATQQLTVLSGPLDLPDSAGVPALLHG
jgi:DNA helicase IV